MALSFNNKCVLCGCSTDDDFIVIKGNTICMDCDRYLKQHYNSNDTKNKKALSVNEYMDKILEEKGNGERA